MGECEKWRGGELCGFNPFIWRTPIVGVHFKAYNRKRGHHSGLTYLLEGMAVKSCTLRLYASVRIPSRIRIENEMGGSVGVL